MKFKSNLLSTASLTATLSLSLSIMVACAPAKKSASFKDRTRTGGAAAEVFFKTRNSTEVEKEFAKSILYVGAITEEAIDTKIGRQKLEGKFKSRKKERVSGLPPIADADSDEAAAIASKMPNNRRENSLISVRVELEGVGALDYMEFNDEYGSEKVMVELSPANPECASKVAEFLSVRAACVDKLCAKLAVQLVDTSGEEELIVNKILDQVGTPTGTQVKVTKFKELSPSVAGSKTAELESDFDSEVESDEAMAAAKKTKPAMACATVAQQVAATKETATKETAAKVIEDKDNNEEIDLSDLGEI